MYAAAADQRRTLGLTDQRGRSCDIGGRRDRTQIWNALHVVITATEPGRREVATRKKVRMISGRTATDGNSHDSLVQVLSRKN